MWAENVTMFRLALRSVETGDKSAENVMGIEVCFTLATIDEIRVSYDFDVPGIYFLFKGGELVYVGKTINFMQRLTDHIRVGRIEYDTYNLIACPLADLDALEALYVRHYKPRLNRGRGGVGRKPRQEIAGERPIPPLSSQGA